MAARTRSRHWRLLPCVCALLVCCAENAFSFGPTGHRAIGRIAEKHLTENAAREIQRLIGPETLSRVSTWPDEIRSDPAWAHSAEWHYVNVEDGETYEPRERPAGENPRNIVEAIDHFTSILKDKSRSDAEKAIALKWLVHLVGDLHQPMHVGRKEDRGGNLIKVEWFGKETNLHAVWDSEMIDTTKLSFSELADYLDTASPKQIERWQKSTVMDWVKESFELRVRAYLIPTPGVSGCYLYSYNNMPIVEQRLSQAGVRLAGLLNSIFDRHSTDSDANALGATTAALWTQNGAEFEGITRAAFVQASQMLEKAIAQPTFTALADQEPKDDSQRETLAHKSPAIIVDVDDTVLNNVAYQAWLIQSGRRFSLLSWNRWIAAMQATATPGSVEFINDARSKGVAVYFATNRDFRGDLDRDNNDIIEDAERNQELEPFTVRNMAQVGLLPSDADGTCLLMSNERDEWKSDKTTRRNWVAEKHRVLLLIGDSLADFTSAGTISDRAERERSLAACQSRWGRSWIVLPNAIYGAWLPSDHDGRLRSLRSWDGRCNSP